jgi:glycosyltransferase involved in cell wall biosynthesis
VPSLSVIMITKDAAGHVRRSLESIRWADEVVVMDSGSNDDTVPICRDYTTKIFVRPFDTFAAQRNAALKRAAGEWILALDADEVVPLDLAREIREIVARPGPGIHGYFVRRQNHFCGRPIRYLWGDDRLLRLFRRESGRFVNDVHEKVELAGPAATLSHPLVHFNSATLREYVRKNALYTRLEAGQRSRRGERGSLFRLLLAPLRVFAYLSLRGYRDGWMGLLLAALLAYFTLRMHGLLWSLTRGRSCAAVRDGK